MKRIPLTLMATLIFGSASVAGAATIFGFTWTTVADFMQTSPSGTTTEAHGTISGSGDLTLTQTPDGFVFTFSGAGGSGSGSTNAAGLIVNEGPTQIGSISYPFPSNVPDVRPGNVVSQGQLTVAGDHLTLTYTDLSRSNTFGPNLSAVFTGTGTIRTTPPVSAPEPAVIAMVGVTLGTALVIGRRRRLVQIA